MPHWSTDAHAAAHEDSGSGQVGEPVKSCETDAEYVTIADNDEPPDWETDCEVKPPPEWETEATVQEPESTDPAAAHEAA